MKKLTGLWFGICFLSSGLVSLGVAAAQDAAGGHAPPKVLVIQREFVKPGRTGSLHEKTEGQFVQAMRAAKWPEHYLAAESLSGRSRVLFLIGYDSFAAWEKDSQDMAKNPQVSAAIDRASIADGDLLSEYSSAAFTYREDMSLRADVRSLGACATSTSRSSR